MKITPQDLNKLSDLLPERETLIKAIETYNAGEFDRADQVKSLKKRFVWDVFYYMRKVERDFIESLDKYMNSAHIETALKHVLKEHIANLNTNDLPTISN